MVHSEKPSFGFIYAHLDINLVATMNDKLHIGDTDKLNGIQHFSLSVDSCMHATVYCRKVCYGKKGNMARPNPKAAYARNLRLSKRDEFIEWMKYELGLDIRLFRIHAVGDFYDLDYFLKWCEIVKAKPHITFLAYTRNPEVFTVSHKPTNLRLIFSVDETTDITRIPQHARKAFIIPRKFKDKEHLEQIGDIKICTNGNCSQCGECWSGTLNIGFPLR